MPDPPSSPPPVTDRLCQPMDVRLRLFSPSPAADPCHEPPVDIAFHFIKVYFAERPAALYTEAMLTLIILRHRHGSSPRFAAEECRHARLTLHFR